MAAPLSLQSKFGVAVAALENVVSPLPPPTGLMLAAVS